MSQNSVVVVIGDIMLDQYHFGQVNRLNPESPNPLLHVERTENRLGGAANVAANLAALWCETVLIGHLWDDAHGEIIQSLCTSYTIKTHYFITEQPTITKTRFVETTYNQQLLRADFELPIQFTDEEQRAICTLLHDMHAEFTIAADYNKGTITDMIMQKLGSIETKLFVDTKSYKIRDYKNIFLLKPNFKELREITGETIANTDTDIERCALPLAQKLWSHIVVTRGKEWASLITKDGTYLHLETEAKTVFDVSGAGDTFMAWLVMWLYKGGTLIDAVKLGNQASALAVSKVGTTIVSAEDLLSVH